MRECVSPLSQKGGGFRLPQHKAVSALDQFFEFSMFLIGNYIARVLVHQGMCARLHVFRHLCAGNRPQRVVGQMLQGIEFYLRIGWQYG